MIKRLEKIVVICILVFGQPINTLADTINSDFQLNNIQHTDDMKDENSSKESLKEYDEDDTKTSIFDNNSDDNIITNQPEDDMYSGEELEKSNIPIDYTEENMYLQNDSQPASDTEEAIAANLTSGVWGTSRWEYDEETKIMKIFEGTAGTSVNRPWGGNSFDVEILVFEGEVLLHSNSSMLFQSYRGEIKGLHNLNTSNVTNMSNMFLGSWETSLDLSNFDTRNVTDMSNMFNASRAEKLDLSNFDTSNVTNMSSMFMGSLATSLEIASFNTSRVIEMSHMFNASRAEKLDLSQFNTSNVRFMNNMFSSSRASSLVLLNFDTRNVINMSGMFLSAEAKTIDVSSFNTRNVTNMSNMFNGTRLAHLDLSSFDTKNVTNMSGMFRNTSQVSKLSLGTQFHFVAPLTIGLPEVPHNDNFLGVWQSMGEGTPENPLGQFEFSSRDLMANYDGETMADLYVWKPNLIGGRILVHYEDRDRIKLAESVIIEPDSIGKPFTTYAKQIPGYTLIETPQNAIGVFTAEEQEVRYIYERTDAAPVTVKHKDSEGNQLAEPVILSGKVGLPYA
ncbi:surface protein, partial [Enterococcus casseliflavus]|uniref:BspA family leucine-rich repeat surface protein n=1 Tax=Enterococcus casseliflavus TaxID=37734 RepID=UPI0008E661B0